MTFPLPGANWSYLHSLTRKDTTGPTGYALVNGTGTILSWTAPDDGQLHRVTVFGTLFASSAETGGAIGLSYIDPGGNANSTSLWPGGLTGANTGNAKTIVIGAGTTVTVVQDSALTGGAAVLWAEIWGN